MDFTVEFVPRNLVTQSNFVGFQDSRIFHEFRSDERRVDPKNEIFRKILKNCQIFKECPFNRWN